MGDHWIQLVLVAVLIIVNALFAGSEMALVSLREGQLRRMEQQGGGAAAAAALARDPNRYLATIQIGITLAGFLASATAAIALAEVLQPALGFLGRAARPVAVVGVTLLLTFLTLVFGELAPKRVAMQHAERWARLAGRPLTTLAAISRPFVWVLSKATDLGVRLMGGDPGGHRDEITPEEVRDLVSVHRGFTAEQRLIIAGAVEITERVLREVLIPRRNVFLLDADLPVDVARKELAGSGFSRAPVVRRRNIDDTIGIVHLRDLLSQDDGTVADVARPVLLLPDSLHAGDALRRFKVERQQFALVVDEHGAVDGIVTMEDLLEEVVGEIYDEADRDVMAVQQGEDGDMLLPGTFPIHDLPDIGVTFEQRPGGDYITVAGLVIAVLGHVPTQPGEIVHLDGWTAQVTSVDRHAITEIRLRPCGGPGGDALCPPRARTESA
ncbi:membrane protein [Catellatospora sp. IY07-71]|uniref:hemolysin family protein n=1 Tax=Catellatospora sp. IY07-71 TaxID=2728827 RepID=UPI001BB4136E|nr:hemolysin family protein [Catellatospora sp. IY07-71]BCJ77073.1 membrane protein [Catellatospora sp. IY07-71]